jgi:hypothetical protein
MRKDTNRTFYFIETENDAKNSVVRVASDFAPVWTNDFATLTDAIDAVKGRNKAAVRFDSIPNGLVAVYVP